MRYAFAQLSLFGAGEDEERATMSEEPKANTKPWRSIPVHLPIPVYDEVVEFAKTRGELITECCRRWIREGLAREKVTVPHVQEADRHELPPVPGKVRG